MDDERHDQPWYAVRCVLVFDAPEQAQQPRLYEERITLLRAASFEEAVERAECEAEEYCDGLDAEYVGLAQAYHLFVEGHVGDGDEVFSLMRTSELSPDEYSARFFATGQELEGKIE